MLREFVFKLITSQAIHFQTNWPSNKKEWRWRAKRKRNEQHAGECFYFTAIIGTNKYKYHIVCDWKSILLLNSYKWWRKRRKKKESGTGHSWQHSKKNWTNKFSRQSYGAKKNMKASGRILIVFRASKTVTWPI